MDFILKVMGSHSILYWGLQIKIDHSYVINFSSSLLRPGIAREVRLGVPGGNGEQQEITLVKGGPRSAYGGPVWQAKAFRFYPQDNRESLRNFKQGSDLVRFVI